MDLNMLLQQFLDENGEFNFPPDFSIPNLAEMLVAVNEMRGTSDEPQIEYWDYSESRDGEQVIYTKRDVNQRIKAVAARLQQIGQPGAKVACLMENSPEYLFGFLGTMYAGMTGMPLYDPKEPGHGDHLASVLERVPVDIVLTNKVSAPQVRALFADRPAAERPRILAVDAIPSSLAESYVSFAEDPKWAVGLDDRAFLMFTSGSSRNPEGVDITSRSVLSNVFQVFGAVHLKLPLRLVTWLPMHHNLGCVLGTLVVAMGLPVTLMSPRDFIQHPERWLEQMNKRNDEEHIYTVIPNFALELANRFGKPGEGESLDLTGVEAIVIGSEPVTEKATREFLANFTPFGLRDDALRPSYGLSEATLLVTTPQLGVHPRVTWVDRDSLNAGKPQEVAANSENSVPLMSNGSVAKPQHLIVVDPETKVELDDGLIGELWLTGDNVPAGYITDAEKSAEAFHNKLAGRRAENSRAEGVADDANWVATGDLGCFLYDEIHITGRIKDLIVIAGRNHYPQDVEYTAEAATKQVLPAVVAAFTIPGDDVEKLVIIAERNFNATPEEDEEAIAAIRSAVSATHGIVPSDVRIVDQNLIPRSSAGKIARRPARQAFIDGKFDN